MAADPPFDYARAAERARKAQQAFKDFTTPATQRLRDQPFPPKKEAFNEWNVLRKTLTYQELLDEFNASIDAAYPPEFDAALLKLRKHTDLKALEVATVFLEADPYFFRSGYIKQWLLRYIRGYQLMPEYVARLQNVILHIVDDHYCREIREYCRLARKINNEELRAQLQVRLNSDDPNIRKRAQWVFDYLGT